MTARSPKGRLVLVVDPDLGFADAMTALLPDDRIIGARSIEEAAVIAEGGRLDLALVGPAFGTEAGVASAARLRDADRSLLTVLVADVPTNRVLRMALRSGFADVIDAPVSSRKLAEVLERTDAIDEARSVPVVFETAPRSSGHEHVEAGEQVVGAAQPIAEAALPPVAAAESFSYGSGTEAIFADAFAVPVEAAPGVPDRDSGARPFAPAQAEAQPAAAPIPDPEPEAAPAPAAPPLLTPAPAIEAAPAPEPAAVAIPAGDAPFAPPLLPTSPPAGPAPTLPVAADLPPMPAAPPPMPNPTPPAVAPALLPAQQSVLEPQPPPFAPPPAREPGRLEPAAEVPLSHRKPGGGRVITVMAGKGGSGKTVTATNLAAALTERLGEDKVVVVDADLQFGDVALMLQIDPTRTIVDAAAVIDELTEPRLDSLLLRHDSGLRVLPAPLVPTGADKVGSKDVIRIVEMLRGMYPFVVVDTAPIFDDGLITLLEHSDEVLMVVDMDLPSVKNAKIALDTLRAIGFDTSRVHLIVNRANSKARLDLAELEKALGKSVAASIPSDRLIPQSVNEGVPAVAFSPRSRVAKAFHAIAELFLPR